MEPEKKTVVYVTAIRCRGDSCTIDFSDGTSIDESTAPFIVNLSGRNLAKRTPRYTKDRFFKDLAKYYKEYDDVLENPHSRKWKNY